MRDSTFGVHNRFIAVDPELQTPLAFAEMDPPEDPSIIFYREPRAPDQNITPDDVDHDVVRDVPIFWLPASRFSDEQSAATVTELLSVRDRKAHTVLDLDWRPMFWTPPLRQPRPSPRCSTTSRLPSATKTNARSRSVPAT